MKILAADSGYLSEEIKEAMEIIGQRRNESNEFSQNCRYPTFVDGRRVTGIKKLYKGWKLKSVQGTP